MNTYMKRNDEQCCYVSLFFDGEKLVLSQPKGFLPDTKYALSLADISHLRFDEHFGAQRIGFVYKNDYYQFYACGLSVIDYMKEQLTA
ncbi:MULTISPECIES: hypothetical protein [unclassified Enterococcus]|jgi:hypothetical protein|uniref:hypothetical protein n=1 Tax=unclassified Enterococcus TaxID=2608891 RepID=UPI0006B9C2BA|nr:MULTISPECIES: hypothetical protein [unclassified Enterococcus]KPG73817.1 hypothetical protein AEQ18_00775 [Enterococcus sp. RIT-PI-f]HCE13196.1 hypothetical protein [Enterococcus sp.]